MSSNASVNTNDNVSREENGQRGVSESSTPEGGYPKQRHAGAVGLGPEYGKGAAGFDKLTGFKEEVAGKITRNPDKVQHGHDLRTGQLKKKQQEEEDKSNPFSGVKGGKEEKEDSNDADRKDTDADGPGHTGGKPEHLTDKGAKEQAATVAPEGTEVAERQRQGQVNPKSIDEA